MSGIGREEVERIAGLAQLTLTGDEAEALARDLDRILHYVETLDELDTDGVEPTAHVIPLETPMRSDTPDAPMDPELVVANAPRHEGTAFVVPKVLESDDEG
jgi:aspartyl-tRNA(Asn)/glutamyl-tRNA(Gln) amidotransferase subunit C